MAAMTLLGFINHLTHFNTHLQAHTAHAFEQVAKIVADEARSEIGVYQAAASPFVGWAELADATKDDRVRQGYSENDPGLRSGGMRDSIGHASDSTGAVVGSDDDKLKWFELGTDKQPPRSVLGAAVVHKEPEITHHLGAAYSAALVGAPVHNGLLPIK